MSSSIGDRDDGALEHVDGEGAGHRRLAAHHLVQERQVVVLRLPQRHGHGRRRRAQPALRHVGARMVRDPAGCIH